MRCSRCGAEIAKDWEVLDDAGHPYHSECHKLSVDEESESET